MRRCLLLSEMHSFWASETTRVLVTTRLSWAGAAAASDIAAPIITNRTVIVMRDLHTFSLPAAILHQAKRNPAGRISRHLEQARRAHASPDAHGHHDVFRAAPLALDERVAGQPCPGGAVGVAHRDRSTVDVEALVGDAQAVAAIDHLHGKGFVQLPQADVLDLKARALEQLRHREHRPDSHLVGLAARHRETAKNPEGLELA